MSTKYFCLCLFITAFLSLVPAYGDGNVLLNPGFEDDTTDPWGGRSCSIEIASDPVRSGSYSGRVFSRNASWQGIKQSMLDRMLPGETYKISGYVRLEAGTEANDVYLTVQQNDSSNNGDPQYIRIDEADANDSDWVRLYGEFTLNVTGVLTTLDVYFECLDPYAIFYVDDANVYGPEPVPPPPPDPNATGKVDVSVRHQNIEGFGASVSWFENWLTAHPLKSELYDILFGELGLDIYRIRNCYDQDGYEAYMSSTSEIITEGEASLGRPIKQMMSSWSPPAYLKSNDDTVRGTLKKDPCDGEFMYEEFAEWWHESLVEWSNYGINAEYLNIQNEPDWLDDWDTCQFEPSETDETAGYNLAFEAVWNELNYQMGPYMPKMLAADAAGIINCPSYLDELIDHSHVYGYSHHLYNIGSGDNPDAYIPAMESFTSTYGDRPLMQTEYSKNTETLADAIDLAVLMHNALTVEGVSVYLYWDLFWGYYGWGYSGLVSIDYPWITDPPPSYTINPVYYAFKHYSAFVHSGWQRVETQCDNPYLRMSAFISPDNKQLSVVLINTTTDTDIELDLSFINSSILDGDVYRTSQTESCVLLDGLAPCNTRPVKKEESAFLKNFFDPVNPLIVPAMTITTLSLSTTGIYPVAVAGPNQTAYAGIDGFAEVTLDGSGSYDDDGDPLSYHWSWTIGGTIYEANGVSPVIELPVGEHLIELIVDDGTNESEPNFCTITVIEPLQANLFHKPSVLNTLNRYGFLIVTIKMPTGISPSDINDDEPLLFSPGNVEAKCQHAFPWPRRRHSRTYVTAFFDKSDCIDNLSPGLNEVNIVGKLTSGRYYNAAGYIWLVPMRWYYWPPFFHRGCKPYCWGRH